MRWPRLVFRSQLPAFVALFALLAASLPAEISIGPEPSAEVVEAYAYLEAGDKEAALKAFNRALEANLQDLPARLGQAMVYADQQRHIDAFTAYDLVVQDYPEHAFAWNGRGLAAFNLEDFDEALSSFERATADQPINGFFYESLAWTHMCRGEFPEAVKTARQATLMYGQNGENASYPLLIAYFSSLESGDRLEANRTLNYALKNKPAADAWPAPVFDYLVEQIDAAELISWVTNSAEETEARTYIGLKLRADGMAEAAKPHLDWVVSSGDVRVFEHTLARSLELRGEVALLGL